MSFLASLIGVLTNPAALLLIAVAFTSGYFRGDSAASSKCETAALTAENKSLKLDRDIAASTARRFEAEAAASAAQAEKNASLLREISNAPKSPACRLPDDLARRVYGIVPRGVEPVAPARVHRDPGSGAAASAPRG